MAETASQNPPIGPTFIPISLVPSNTSIITGPTSVNFTVTLPPGQGQPALTVTYYGSDSAPGPITSTPIPIEQDMNLDVITMPNPPTPVWVGDHAEFTLNLNDTAFNVLPAGAINLMVIVRISDTSVNSLGIASLPINLPPIEHH